MNAYSFNTNSKSKKIDKTMISIHLKVRNCQVVLPINVNKLSSEDRKCTGLGLILSRDFGKNPIFAYHQSIAYHFLVTAQRSKHATNNTLLLRCIWMSHKLQTFEVNEASFSGVRIHVTCRIPAKSHAFHSLTDALPL